MESISCHITPLDINSLGSEHTHTHANTHTDDPHRTNCKKPCVPATGLHMPGLKIVENKNKIDLSLGYMYYCVTKALFINSA